MNEEDITYWKERAERYETQLRNMGVRPIEKRGLHNWKNLFRKPTLTDWITLFMIVMALFIAWAYQHDIAVCKEYVKNAQANFNLSNIDYSSNITYPKANFSGILITTTEVKNNG